ncbi:MAG: hypothetical protein RIF37_09935 [Rhodospirillaceae bacterium]
MFKHAASYLSSRDTFKSTRTSRLERSLMWKAIRNTKTKPAAKAEQERGPPEALAAA